jgi:hypothetical protein
MLTDDLLQRGENGDLDALAALDRQGLLLGAEESLEEYAERLRSLQANIGRMDADLADTGSFTVEDLTVEADQRIPGELFAEPQDTTRQLYDFGIDWVPGFFITPQGVLFGGCAYYFYPDFFALFIIRRAFAERDRWLIYRRSELLAHELCHIARIGLGSTEYEEVFAYRTANSGFRRFFGGIFRTQWDSFSFLGTAFVILLGRLLQIFRFHSLPQWPFWVPFLVCLLAQLGRHKVVMRRLDQARRAVAAICADQAEAVLFRCTDAELHALAGLRTAAEATAWVEERCADSWRWRVIRHRFLTPPAAEAAELQ